MVKIIKKRINLYHNIPNKRSYTHIVGTLFQGEVKNVRDFCITKTLYPKLQQNYMYNVKQTCKKVPALLSDFFYADLL